MLFNFDSFQEQKENVDTIEESMTVAKKNVSGGTKFLAQVSPQHNPSARYRILLEIADQGGNICEEREKDTIKGKRGQHFHMQITR
jgi:hypothetical protein